MVVLNSLITNIYLYWGIIIGLLVVEIFLTILCLRRYKREKIKKDFLELEKQTEEVKEEQTKPFNTEILEILEKMEEDSKLKPEEVVRKFEDDQELNAIISYQELVDSVNNNNIEIEENDAGDIDFVKQLEMELANENNEIKEPEKLEDTLKNTFNIVDDSVSSEERVVSVDDSSHMDVIDEMNDDKKFVHSDIISPVFGKITDFTKYSIHKGNQVEVKQVAGNSLEDEIKNNEAFLKALVKFRNNL